MKIISRLKKAIAFSLTILNILGLCACASKPASISWEKQDYTDGFGDPTGKYYVTTSKRVSGKYNGSSVSDGKLEAQLRVDENGISILLYENGTDLVKNDTDSPVFYDITVKTPDSNKFTVEGTMEPGSNFIQVNEPQQSIILHNESRYSIAQALNSENGEVSFYVTQRNRETTNYLFSVLNTGFSSVYDAEILDPIRGKIYDHALWLLSRNDYINAASYFELLGAYKDSQDQSNNAKEQAYKIAMGLVNTKKYQEAKAAFEELGYYKDSKEQAENAEKLFYDQIEQYIQSGQYTEALYRYCSLDDKDGVIKVLKEADKFFASKIAIDEDKNVYLFEFNTMVEYSGPRLEESEIIKKKNQYENGFSWSSFCGWHIVYEMELTTDKKGIGFSW